MNQSLELCVSAKLLWIDVVLCRSIIGSKKTDFLARLHAFEAVVWLAEIEQYPAPSVVVLPHAHAVGATGSCSDA